MTEKWGCREGGDNSLASERFVSFLQNDSEEPCDQFLTTQEEECGSVDLHMYRFTKLDTYT